MPFLSNHFQDCAAAARPFSRDRDQPAHRTASAAGLRGRESGAAECGVSRRLADGVWAAATAGAEGVA